MTASLTPPRSPFRRPVAVAAYGAPPGVVSSGYSPGADTLVASKHQHQHRRQSLAHSQTDPLSPSFPYASQNLPRSRQQDAFPQYTGDDVSPTCTFNGPGGGNNYTSSPAEHDPFELPPAKRQKIPSADMSRRPTQVMAARLESPARLNSLAEASPPYSKGDDASRGRAREKTVRRDSGVAEPKIAKTSPTTAAKPKRVRTGCLTCRNRHLKCDEAMPVCVNCQKSNRKCERGVRLNFIDLKVEQPPYLLPPVDWKVQFQDESRQIASEYVGGLARYARVDQQVVTPPQEGDVEVESRSQRASEPVLSGHDHVIESQGMNRHQHPLSFYYPGGMSRIQESAHTNYEDQMGHDLSRKSSDAFLAMGSGPTPTSSHSGGGGRVASFSMAISHDPYGMREDTVQPTHSYKTSDVSSVASSLVPQGVASSSSGSFRHATGSRAADPHEGLMTPQSEKNGERDYLNTREEIHYMQVFIDEVAIWMDSLDNQKHFGRVIPYLALKSPMLMNAFLACGVKHLTLVDKGSYRDDKALYYYDTATTQLLRSLQNPERNTAECATTAVVLNVYEIMSEKPAARMNHIAGARALIRECKWDARSTGIGAACFWLNVGMEVLSCLAFNWATAWDPDHWGLDPGDLMAMAADSPGPDGRTPSSMHSGGRGATGASEDFPSTTGDVAGVGEEEIWVHRILYIVAKVANFRANIPQFQEPSPHDEQVRLQSRFAEWQRLKNWCDTWNANCPRSMRPYGYLFASSTNSAFPNVWLIKRAAIVGRLFYHTAMCLLAQINPLKPSHHDDDEIRTVQLHHAHQVCGIAAHTKDHGVASVAIRSLAIAGAVLHEPREQHEVLDILTRIHQHTGWNLKRVDSELKRAWGWEPPEPPLSGPNSSRQGSVAGLPPPPAPPQAQPPRKHQHMTPAEQGGTLGAAAVVNQLFGPRDANNNSTQQQQQQDTTTTKNNSSGGDNYHDRNHRRASQPPTTLSRSTPTAEARRATITSNPPPPPTHHHHNHNHQVTFAQPSFFSSSSPSGSGARHGSVAAASPSSHASPTTTHTPASASLSLSAYSGGGGTSGAPTPPARPTVNPLLAQADFTQPNHPYREWYKPPERPAAERLPEKPRGRTSTGGSLGTGGLWPY